MKKTCIVGLFLLGMLACQGARAEVDEQILSHRLDRLQTELSLSDQQKQDVGKIFEETRPQLEALRKQMRDLREQMRTRLKAVLTPEQMEKFEKLHQQRGEPRRRMGRSD